MGTAAQLRAKHARIAAAKEAAAAEDIRAHLALDPGERLAVALRHCDAHLAAFGPKDLPDDEVATWQRVRKHLAGLR